LQEVGKCAEGKLTTEEFNNKLFLGTDNMGKAACQLAAEYDNLETLQKVWEWAK
jgi:hypothetical protein